MSLQILLLEPFYGGSHKQLIDLIQSSIGTCCDLYSLPAKKWHWRARTSALYFSQNIPTPHNYRVLFCSSVLNLAELVALRPDLICLKKVLYFHENQLVYPVRKQQDRDFQYGYNQILSCLVADVVVFNSEYNKESFLRSIQTFLKLIPDHRPKGLAEQIQPKCQVLYFPIELSALVGEGSGDISSGPGHWDKPITEEDPSKTVLQMRPYYSEVGHTTTCSNMPIESTITTSKSKNACSHHLGKGSGFLESCDKQCESSNINKDNLVWSSVRSKNGPDRKTTRLESSENAWLADDESEAQQQFCWKAQPLHIVWPHRWEHDKDPETFFKILYQLQEDDIEFCVSVMGETFTDVPDVFTEAKMKLDKHIHTWGYQDNKGDYYNVLRQADIVVSTALHEFYGVAMLEGVYFDCFPLCPNRLVYPELFPSDCLYNTPQQLCKRLRRFVKFPHLVRSSNIKENMKLERFSWTKLCSQYTKLLMDVT